MKKVKMSFKDNLTGNQSKQLSRFKVKTRIPKVVLARLKIKTLYQGHTQSSKSMFPQLICTLFNAEVQNIRKNIAIKSTGKIPHRNRSQVQVSLKVTAQIDHLNITVMFDIFSIDQSPEIAGKLNNYVLDYK